MENGNINDFIERDRHVNRTELVRHHLTPAGATPMHYPVGWGRKWLGVHARPTHSTRRSEGGTNFAQTDRLHTYASVDREGKHTDQRGPTSLYRRLRSLDHHWRRNCCGGLSGVVDL